MPAIEHHQQLNLWLGIAIALIAYIGVYLSAAAPKVYRQTGVDGATGRNVFRVERNYSADAENGFLTVIFAPAHLVDRRFRAEYWATIEHSSGQTWRNPEPHSSSERGVSAP